MRPPSRPQAVTGLPGIGFASALRPSMPSDGAICFGGSFSKTARVPWDDRRALDARVEDIREAKVREYLHDVRSGLLDEPKRERQSIAACGSQCGSTITKSPGMRAFSSSRETPPSGFGEPGSRSCSSPRIEPGDVQEERTFGGGLVDSGSRLFESSRKISRPTTFRNSVSEAGSGAGSAIRSQRSERPSSTRSITVATMSTSPSRPRSYLYPSRVEIISYPGPVPGIEAVHLVPNAEARAAPARNRRIGEFLKELGLAEGRLTGLRKCVSGDGSQWIAGATLRVR